ncbi:MULTISPECIES: hypothetical protein [Streptomyces]|uniref:hypothetical protein n=1 Tax=Streptomyces TaxID=1883 RepID=UPI0006B01B02|nr:MULTISPECIES: hypothetical protein [unclassified Streptomyces]KOU69374.1 hypothetical protein ADK96_08520 [Streptomyces sp. IGB124]KOU81889.1 hypothetical protein ADK61_07970 [Streptomyces sp. XY66]KOV13613.1 hypothetical protein ADK90_37370 [Streptomyces sp. XY413]
MEPTTDRLKTPRAAGMAGVAFALLLGAAIVLMRISIPGDAADATIDQDRRWAVQLALQIVPFAGIFFLWFMGALRAHTGEAEDRFIATVFLGSGFVFVATLFAAAAAAGTVLNEETPSDFGRHYAYTLLATYAMRMAAVFVLATSMIGRTLGVFPRPLAMLGTLVGLILIVVGAGVPWSELLFPAWALVISLYILRVRRTAAPTDRAGPP